MNHFTDKKAYQAMFYFLENLYERTNSDELGALLGSMSLLEDGITVDPAIWEDWQSAIKKAADNDLEDINLKLN